MAHNRYENACQKSQRIHQNIQYFSDNPLLRIVRINGVNYLYNLFDNIIKINRTPYNIQWKGKHPIIIDNDKSRIDILPSIGKLAEIAITSYLVCLIREKRIEQIHFFLVQYATESCPIPKSLGDVIKLLADIQKKQLVSYFEKLKLLKNRNFYEVVNLSKRRKAIKNCWVFNIKSDSYYRS